MIHAAFLVGAAASGVPDLDAAKHVMRMLLAVVLVLISAGRFVAIARDYLRNPYGTNPRPAVDYGFSGVVICLSILLWLSH